MPWPFVLTVAKLVIRKDNISCLTETHIITEVARE